MQNGGREENGRKANERKRGREYRERIMVKRLIKGKERVKREELGHRRMRMEGCIK